MSNPIVQQEVSGYNQIFSEKNYDRRAGEAQHATDSFYTLVTEFYEKGWGQSFHFAPRFNGESFEASIARHEHYLALKLQLTGADKVLDAGCGVMGPARTIARFSGANITGLTINHHQVERCKQLNAKSAVGHLLQVRQGDFMNIPFADNTFDKAYAIEALCHAPSIPDVYKQINSKLKPGGKALFYEWAMTDKYDPNNAEHVRIKEMIEYGNGICELKTTADIDRAIEQAGFVKEEVVDLALTGNVNAIPWYATLQSGWSFAQLRHTKLGRSLTQGFLRVAEFLRIVPKGVSKAHEILVIAADGLVLGGEQQIFTPMYMVLVSKKK